MLRTAHMNAMHIETGGHGLAAAPRTTARPAVAAPQLGTLPTATHLASCPAAVPLPADTLAAGAAPAAAAPPVAATLAATHSAAHSAAVLPAAGTLPAGSTGAAMIMELCHDTSCIYNA